MDLGAAIVWVHVGEIQGSTPRFCAVEWMTVKVQWAYGIEATKAEIKGGCRLTHSGWVAVTKGPTCAQQCHRATLISSSQADSDRVCYQCRQAG